MPLDAALSFTQYNLCISKPDKIHLVQSPSFYGSESFFLWFRRMISHLEKSSLQGRYKRPWLNKRQTTPALKKITINNRVGVFHFSFYFWLHFQSGGTANIWRVSLNSLLYYFSYHLWITLNVWVYTYRIYQKQFYKLC